jgi:hypothetical protein
MARTAARRGPCIVCGTETEDKVQGSGRSHFRCADGEECAVRRNARKKRPKPEAEVRRLWRER